MDLRQKNDYTHSLAKSSPNKLQAPQSFHVLRVLFRPFAGLLCHCPCTLTPNVADAGTPASTPATSVPFLTQYPWPRRLSFPAMLV